MKNNKENFILSIDTTSKICGVSLICNNKIIYEENIDKGLNHSITLFNNIDNALKYGKIDFSQISNIKVSNGPGSFTGIRIGIAAAIGLSEIYNTKIEYIDTLDGLAYNAKNINDYIISMIDARVDRVFFAIYNSKTLKKYYNDMIININDFCKLMNEFFSNINGCFSLIGDGAVNYKSIFKNNLKVNFNIIENKSIIKASSIGFSNGIISKCPIINYLLASKAEREKNDKH